MAAIREIVVPDIGDFKDVPVIEILVKPGDTVKPEDPLVTLESDKATMDVPAPAAGVVKELRIKVGDRVSQGSPVLTLEGLEAAPAPAPAPGPALPSVQLIPASTSSHGGVADVRVPPIGDFKDVPVIEVLVKPGDSVKPEDPLVTLESDKATMDVPSPFTGTVRQVLVKAGDRVSEGTRIVELVTRPPSGQTPAVAPVVAPPAAPSAGAPPTLAYAGPAVRRLARERGIDLGKVDGTGPRGRILREDLDAVATSEPKKPAAAQQGTAGLALLPWPEVDFAKLGPIEVKPLARIRKISGANLHRNWVMIPHVTQHEDADITELEAFRVAQNKENEASGVKITLLAFLVKACVATLQKFPELNASLTPDGESLVLKGYYNIGFAADTPNGLVVPVIKGADKKGVLAVAKETHELAKLARDGKLKLGDIQGATFTISSLGGIGGTAFTPIINAPELAILGVSRSATKPVWDGKQFVPRLILPLSLSYDHRVIDGAAAARWITYLASILADMRRVIL